jgi:hypothetical protein
MKLATFLLILAVVEGIVVVSMNPAPRTLELLQEYFYLIKTFL